MISIRPNDKAQVFLICPICNGEAEIRGFMLDERGPITLFCSCGHTEPTDLVKGDACPELWDRLGDANEARWKRGKHEFVARRLA